MVGRRIVRYLRRHGRSAAIWFAIPLAVLNSHATIGCGCTGHFESVCHCECGVVAKQCCKQHHGKKFSSFRTARDSNASGCPSCCRQATRGASAAQVAHHNESEALQGHRCKSIVMQEVIPVTLAPSVDANGVCSSMLVAADLILPTDVGHSEVVGAIDFDTGPPPKDWVVILHRLVI
jgi:hypothetical protein